MARAQADCGSNPTSLHRVRPRKLMVIAADKILVELASYGATAGSGSVAGKAYEGMADCTRQIRR